jgi:predicted ATP-dependent protease
LKETLVHAQPLEPLAASRVRRTCEPDLLGFDTTAELEPLPGMLGQARAEEALRFGIGIKSKGFHLFVLGPAGLGKHRLVAREIEARAQTEPIPEDWVYVHSFADADRPRAMSLPAGRGAALVETMDRAVRELSDAIRLAFESDEFRNRRRVIEQRVEGLHEEAFSALAEEADKKSMRLMRTPNGVALAPIKNGEVLNPQQFASLSLEEQAEYKGKLDQMEEGLRSLMQQVPKWQREAREELRKLERGTAAFAVALHLREVRERFADVAEVAEWLSEVEEDVVEHAPDLVKQDDEDGPEAEMKRAIGRSVLGPLARYRVNLFVDRRGATGAPVVYEEHPTLDRLIGRVEQRAQMGMLISDFTLIKAGAIQRANGGYLVVDARRLLESPQAYDSLKRALRAGAAEIESLGKALGMSAGSLEPEPIPIDLKLVLIGERRLYYTLSALDPDFDQLFKVAADFEDDVEWNDASVRDLARLMAGVAQGEKLLPIHKSAVARVIEHAARLVDHQQKLSTNLTRIADLLRESDWIARQRKAELTDASDVAAAIAAQDRRESRIRERVYEQFATGTVLLDTSGKVVGQINGLSVSSVGRASYGRATRITARVRLGKGEVVDIEREVQLGGPIHSKGVMILAGYLGAHYGLERPLSLSASLVFEQSYAGVEGDSASLAELCALLSALADIPIQQRFAVTGSINQRGGVQAIGGANEKVEGFFDIVSARGLDGTHGVLLPPANVQHLMLRPDVADAVKEGRFHVYAVSTVSQALELLTGVLAGNKREDGTYPEDTLHGQVERRLAYFAARAREFASPLTPEEKRPIDRALEGDPS